MLRAEDFCPNHAEAQAAEIPSVFNINLETATVRGGWTWSDSGRDGDMLPLDTIRSPDGTLKASIPELYYKTRSYWRDLWGDCRYADTSYSQAAGIAFITGNEKNVLGLELPKSYAPYGDTVVELHSNPENASQYRGDVNAFKKTAHLPETDYIYGPADLGYTKGNNIYFAVVDGNKNKWPCILQPESRSQRCDLILILGNDIELH